MITYARFLSSRPRFKVKNLCAVPSAANFLPLLEAGCTLFLSFLMETCSRLQVTLLYSFLLEYALKCYDNPLSIVYLGSDLAIPNGHPRILSPRLAMIANPTSSLGTKLDGNLSEISMTPQLQNPLSPPPGSPPSLRTLISVNLLSEMTSEPK